jgi:hypothetical protein
MVQEEMNEPNALWANIPRHLFETAKVLLDVYVVPNDASGLATDSHSISAAPFRSYDNSYRPTHRPFRLRESHDCTLRLSRFFRQRAAHQRTFQTLRRSVRYSSTSDISAWPKSDPPFVRHRQQTRRT